jgi:hypothetical protein
MIGNIIGIAIGVGTILLGLKGFGTEGLPFTSSKRLTDTGAKIVGSICLLLGLAFIAVSIYGFIPRTR